jgi:diguanylate cyclase (GGDEF)-like protein
MHAHDEKIESLGTVEIFSQLKEYELEIIAKYSEMISYNKGDIIFSQDAEADRMYVVRSGRIGIISVNSADGVMIAQIVAGESFGELDFLGKTPRSASAMAEEDSGVLCFPARRFSAAKIFADHPYISAILLYRLLGIISGRILNVRELLDGKTQWIHDLKKQLLCDKMTGLYNQIYLNEDLISFLPATGKSAALLMIKPDNFKDVNDRCGHKAGDQVLVMMAIFLQSELGEDDIGIRFKGDEFAAVIIDTDREKAIERAKGIMTAYKTMDTSRITGGENIVIRVSIGISLYPDHVADSARLVDDAYRKMFRARESGGSRIVI